MWSISIRCVRIATAPGLWIGVAAAPGVRVGLRRRRGVRRSAAPLRLLRRRSSRGVCLRVRGPTAATRSARWPAWVVAVERLPHQAADELSHRHARVHVREQPPELLQPLLALRVDSRLHLVAAVAERSHPVGRRRQLRVQVGQHPADLPVERPLQLRGGAQRQRAVAQPLPCVRLIGAQPHGADTPSSGRVAVAELAHRVVEQAGEASLQIQAARLDLGQVVDDGALQVPFVADQVPPSRTGNGSARSVR